MPERDGTGRRAKLTQVPFYLVSSSLIGRREVQNVLALRRLQDIGLLIIIIIIIINIIIIIIGG